MNHPHSNWAHVLQPSLQGHHHQCDLGNKQLFVRWGQRGISLKCNFSSKLPPSLHFWWFHHQIAAQLPSFSNFSIIICQQLHTSFCTRHLQTCACNVFSKPRVTRLKSTNLSTWGRGQNMENGSTWENVRNSLFQEKDNLFLECPEDFAISLPPCVSWECPASRQAEKHWHSPFLGQPTMRMLFSSLSRFKRDKCQFFPSKNFGNALEHASKQSESTHSQRRWNLPKIRVKISEHQPIDMTLAFKSLNCAEEPTCCAEPFGDRGHWETGRPELMGFFFTSCQAYTKGWSMRFHSPFFPSMWLEIRKPNIKIWRQSSHYFFTRIVNHLGIKFKKYPKIWKKYHLELGLHKKTSQKTWLQMSLALPFVTSESWLWERATCAPAWRWSFHSLPV